MSYYPDLGQETMVTAGSHVRAIGWLSGSVKYPKGKVSKEFVEKLEVFTERYTESRQIYTIYCEYLGFHSCEMCRLSSPRFTHGGNIGIPAGDILFVAPAMVLHYVVKHNYRPPDSFIDAVLVCPMPGTDEYTNAVVRFRELQEKHIVQRGKESMEKTSCLCRRLNKEAKARQKAKKDSYK